MSIYCYSYFDEVIRNPQAVLDAARWDLRELEFDTMVGTGLSGAIGIPPLAMAMDKKFLILRKDGEPSHMQDTAAVGNFGKKWLFVDDFVASGETRFTVMYKVRQLVERSQASQRYWSGSDGDPVSAECVGSYLYSNRVFTPASKLLRNKGLASRTNGDVEGLLNVKPLVLERSNR